MRNVIVHYHIFKNAGTSIDECLADSFGTKWHIFDLNYEWDNITVDALSRHLSEHPTLLALSSHQARWPEPSSESLRVHPIVLLRHPIDRIGSMYSFEVRRGEPSVVGRSLAEFVDRMLEPESGWVARSFQTLFLSDDQHLTKPPNGPSTEVTAAHFAQAVSRLENLANFGLVERFEASIAMFAQQLKPYFPDLLLFPRTENVSAGRAASLDDRLTAIRRAIGVPRYGRLQDANEADMVLWNRAGRMFDARVRGAERQSRPPLIARVFRPGRSSSMGPGKRSSSPRPS